MRQSMLLPIVLTLAGCAGARVDPPPLRVATYNASLYDDVAGGLVRRLEAGDDAARKVAAVIQAARPDLLLLNEFDYDAEGRAADLFQQRYLAQPQGAQAPIDYPYRWFGPVNTGVPSGLDLDGNGRNDDPGDAWGFGRHPGQYGLLVLSKHPIDTDAVRTFRNLRWAAMPDPLAPADPATGKPWYAPQLWTQLRLSSKTHADVPVRTPLGVLHFLVHHPTPPVFDGAEDRNGRRNHDEIRLWADYLDPPRSGWLVDDAGRAGGLAPDARFVVAGDHNADPLDGDSTQGAIHQLLDHPRIDARVVPASAGAVASARADGGANATHRGDPAHDTGRFGARVGNLRLDYVLPSKGLEVVGAGVWWPAPGEPGADAVEASDHRLVWIDVR